MGRGIAMEERCIYSFVGSSSDKRVLSRGIAEGKGGCFELRVEQE